MAITAAICNSFKVELLAMTPHTAADTYKIALYPNTATLNKSTTAYSNSGELATAGNYTQGGIALVGFTVAADGDAATLDWTTDPSWANATFTARGALIYNSSRSNKSVCVLDFGGDITATAATFTVTLPAAAAATAVIHLS